MDYVFVPPPVPSLPVAGTAARFPVRRVFCVGRNYADHAREMGAHDQADGREPPFFFYKPADAVVSGAETLQVRYPTRTADLHHEVELVVALRAGGASLAVDAAADCIFGYGVGLDLTRRDLQAHAKAKGQPWDMAKGFDQSAVCSVLQPQTALPDPQTRIWLSVNGARRQDGRLGAMHWNIPEIIAQLSTLVCLAPGDLIYTGTPAGVGPLQRGDRVTAGVDGIGELVVEIV